MNANFAIDGSTETQNEAIKARYLLVHSDLEEDKRIWPLETTGNFSIKSYCNLKRPKG